jgi:hypothetical protein
LNDDDRPKFTRPTSSALVRDVYGDVVGYATKRRLTIASK